MKEMPCFYTVGSGENEKDQSGENYQVGSENNGRALQTTFIPDVGDPV